MAKKRSKIIKRHTSSSSKKTAAYFAFALALLVVVAAGITFFQNKGNVLQFSPENTFGLEGLEGLVFPQECSFTDRQEIRDSWNSIFSFTNNIFPFVNDANIILPLSQEEGCKHFVAIKLPPATNSAGTTEGGSLIVGPIDYSGFESVAQGWSHPAFAGSYSSRSGDQSYKDNSGALGGTHSWELTSYNQQSTTKASVSKTYTRQQVSNYNNLTILYHVKWENPSETTTTILCNDNLVRTLNRPGTSEWTTHWQVVTPSLCNAGWEDSFQGPITITINASFTGQNKKLYLDGINLTGYGISSSETADGKTIIFRGWINDDDMEPRTKIVAIKADFSDTYTNTLRNYGTYSLFLPILGIDPFEYNTLVFGGKVKQRDAELGYPGSIFNFFSVIDQHIHNVYARDFKITPENFTAWNYTWSPLSLIPQQHKSYFTYYTADGAEISGVISNAYDLATWTYMEDDCTTDWQLQDDTCVNDEKTVIYEDQHNCGNLIGFTSLSPANGSTTFEDCDGAVGVIGTPEDIFIGVGGTEASVTIGGEDFDDSETYSGNQEVELTLDGKNITDFTWDFSDPLNLKEVLVSTGSEDGAGFTSIMGFSEASQTIYVPKIDPSSQLCILDLNSYAGTIGSCTGEGMVKITCPSSSGDYPCALSGNSFAVSSITGFTNGVSIVQISDGDGGSCTQDLNCTEWSDPVNQCGTRTCEDLNGCGYEIPSSETSLSCGGSSSSSSSSGGSSSSSSSSSSGGYECTADSDCFEGEICESGSCVASSPKEVNWTLWAIIIGVGVVVLVAIILLIHFVLNKPQSTIPQNYGSPQYGP